MTRRGFLGQLVGCGACLAAPVLPGARVSAPALDALLDEVERRAVRYFYEQADPVTGLVRDRVRFSGPDGRRIASIAATGYGLSALCIADQRRFLPPGEARRRARLTLEYLAGHADHQRGFFWHFLDMHSGARVWDSEASSIDTGWLLCGALHARSWFGDAAITSAADEIVGRVDWRWMLNGSQLLSHGWKPEIGFLHCCWDTYCELLAMYLLALGSAGSAIPASSWDAWKRPVRRFGPYTYIDSDTPLFTHQYSHAWMDFRQRRDRYTDYFVNSQIATLAHRLACVQCASQFPYYSEQLWGVTAADSQAGYRGGEVPDGRLVPSAAGGSVAFLPRECGAVLQNILQRYGAKVWNRYGFIDAFDPQQAWFDRDVIGIDQGIMLLMAENARTGAVWNSVMANPEVQRGFAAAGFKPSSGPRA